MRTATVVSPNVWLFVGTDRLVGEPPDGQSYRKCRRKTEGSIEPDIFAWGAATRNTFRSETHTPQKRILRRGAKIEQGTVNAVARLQVLGATTLKADSSEKNAICQSSDRVVVTGL
jgi:hypothetical protein